MRTKILKYFGMVVVLIIMVNLTSCEVSIESWYDDDDYSEIYYRTTRELCSRTWQETWEQDGEYYTNIWLAGNFLKGTLDGVNVNFTGIR